MLSERPVANSVSRTHAKAAKTNSGIKPKPRTKRIRTVQGSCNQCLKHRVKCSLDKPACKRCLRNGVECNYDRFTLKWGKVLNIDTQADNKDGDRSTSGTSSNSGVYTFSGRNAKPLFTLIKSINDKGKRVVSVADNSNTGEIHHVSGPLNSAFELEYFRKVLIAKLHAFGKPLSEADMEVAKHSPVLQNLIGTLTAYHIHNTNPKLLSSEEVQRRKSESIQLLVEKIHQETAESGSVTDLNDMEALLDACILMSTLDSVIDCTSFDIVPTHLFGARAILNEIIKRDPSFLLRRRGGSPLTSRLISIFVTMDLVYCILTGESTTCIPQEGWSNLSGCDCWFGTVNSDDPFLKVMEALSFLTNSQLLMKSNNLRGSIMPALEQTFGLLMELSCPTVASAWNIFVAGYADVGLIYYNRAILGANIDDEHVQSIVGKFITRLNVGPQSPSRSGGDIYLLDHCLLLPLLVIGAHCIQESQQMFIRRWVGRAILSFKNIDSLFEYFDKLWSVTRIGPNTDPATTEGIRQMNWWNLFGEIAKKSIIF
ncbi:DEKNAAC100153 [Brettanomyces naardenensis]|uniref:DEKNAAC100153 n=1 Tax=Brettanomyces naardenensis TaxID=13370 RepID=A0A448YG96_BRENA|nr:DEKNAAC100153 [Brettanomyces naardenensis]